MRWLLILLLLLQGAFALEVRETRWGFNGQVVPGRFNLISVFVSEPSPNAFEGELVLFEERGGMKVGASYAQPIFVSPGTSRWVQFLPYVSEENSWRLQWGKGEQQSRELEAPSRGAPGTVLITDPSSTFASTARLRVFPEDLFPTSVAATDTLDQVVLDYVPRWDATRREAFLDWVRKGGIVHLLRGPRGHPVFRGDLAVLNATAEARAHYGVGSIVRHGMSRAECDERQLADAGYPARELKQTDGSTPVLYRFDEHLLQHLAGLTRPDVQWWLLYLLTLGYLVVICPVHYYWSRTVDYRVAIAGFLGAIVVFALAFMFAGHRGAGESQTSHAITIARSLGGNRWDVLEWVSAFATEGDFYRLSHDASANYYAVPTDLERVKGSCVGGKDGHLDVDIPLFSARPFMHRAVMTGPAATVRIIQWDAAAVELELPGDFSAEPLRVYAYWRQQVLQMKRDGRRLRWESRNWDSTKEPQHFFQDLGRTALLRFDATGRTLKPQEWFVPLMARALGDVSAVPHSVTSLPLATDQLQLFILAESPASFSMKGKGFNPGKGHTVYAIDLFRKDGPRH